MKYLIFLIPLFLFGQTPTVKYVFDPAYQAGTIVEDVYNNVDINTANTAPWNFSTLDASEIAQIEDDCTGDSPNGLHKSLYFPGTGCYLQPPVDANLRPDTGESFSVVIWYKWLGGVPAANKSLWRFWGTGTTSGVGMYVNTSGYLIANVICASGVEGINIRATDTLAVDGNWHMITITYDRSAVKGYFDNNTPFSNSASGDVTIASNFWIGVNQGGYGAFNGYVYSVEYYDNIAITATQVNTLYAEGIAVPSAGQDKGFKEHSKFKRFKGLK